MRAYFHDKFPDELDGICSILMYHVNKVQPYFCLELKRGDWELVSKKRQVSFQFRDDRIKLINKKISRTRYIEFDIIDRCGIPVLKTVINDGYSELSLEDIIELVNTFQV